jgi:hypothetical protein
MSASGTKATFAAPRLKVRLRADCRRSVLNVSFRAETRFARYRINGLHPELVAQRLKLGQADLDDSQACPVTKVTLRPYKLFTRIRDARVYALKGLKRHFCHFSVVHQFEISFL